MLSKDGFKKPVVSFLILSISAVGLAGCNSSETSLNVPTTQSENGCSTSMITDRVIVKMRSDESAVAINSEGGEDSNSSSALESESSAMAVESALSSVTGNSGHGMERISGNTFSVQLQADEVASDVVGRLKGDSQVEYAEPDYVVQGTASFSDPNYSKVWAHAKIQSEQAWDIGQGSKNVIVAVLDSGIDSRHPDLAPNMWQNPGEIAGNGVDDDRNGKVDDTVGWDFANNDANPNADDSPTFHGTHCAGTIGAAGGNGIGAVGHAPKVSLMALKFLNSSGSGYTSNAVKAVDYALSKGVKIISNSWGSFSYSQAMADAVARAAARGVLFTAAAGNTGSNNDSRAFYPANYRSDNVISVAATDSADRLAGFSDYGATTVHIGAPGVGIYSTKNGGAYQSLSGTSMATPLVSGVLALMVSRRPELSYRQIKNALLQSVDQLSSLRGKVITGGRINAFKAMNAINNSSIPDTSAPIPPTTSPGSGLQTPCI